MHPDWNPLLADLAADHGRFDDNNALWSAAYEMTGGRIFCGRGCSACCTLAVTCTFTEALAIAERLPERHSGRLAAHVARLREASRRATDITSFLRLHRQECGACPFLDEDGACGIYESRPFSCRALLATKESRWCATDFATVSREEKEAFVASLDRSVVAFPMHYAASPRDEGAQFETGAAAAMAARFGVALSGSLPFLVHMEREFRLSEAVRHGHDAVLSLLARTGNLDPYLVDLERQELPAEA